MVSVTRFWSCHMFTGECLEVLMFVVKDKLGWGMGILYLELVCLKKKLYFDCLCSMKL